MALSAQTLSQRATTARGQAALRISLIDRNGATFSRYLKQRLDALEAAIDSAAVKAAAEANRVSKDKAKAIRPPAPPRNGRRDAPGALARTINWKAAGTGVSLNVAELNGRLPWWIAQEIGTGNSAVMKFATGETSKNNAGRKAKNTINAPGSPNRAVKSQRGRRIPGSLVFATGPGGRYVHPIAGRRTENLQRAYGAAGQPLIKGLPQGPPGRSSRASAVYPIYIKREIPAKHFVQQGAREGFRDYRNDVVAAAHAALGKRRP